MIIPLRYQWGLLSLVLVVILPVSTSLAIRAWDSPWYCFLLWPLAHVSLLHLTLNLYAWLWQWPLVTPTRLAAAYLSSVAAGLLYITTPHTLPLLGFSGVIFFFLGLTFPLRTLFQRILLISLQLLPLLLFATIAVQIHAFCFLCGLSYYYIRVRWRKRKT